MDHSDPLRTLFADDLAFHQPGRNPTSGKLFVPTELVLQRIGLRPPVDVEPRAAS